MIKAVIFDFDGTIANTIPAIREGVNATMRRYGYPEHSDAAILSFINFGARQLIRNAMPAELRGDEALVDRVLADYNEDYSRVYDHTRVAYGGIPELLDRLHRAGHPVGILSNKQDVFVKKLSEQVLLRGSWDSAHGVGPGQPAKPDPFLSELVARELGVKTSECIMVGDSDVDIRTAENAGMLHVGVSWGYRDEDFLRAHGAVRIARTVDELEAILHSCLTEA